MPAVSSYTKLLEALETVEDWQEALGILALDADLTEIAALSNVSGDILYTDSTPSWARLAKGSDGQYLKLASGFPSWATLTVTSLSVVSQVFAASGTYTPTSGMVYCRVRIVGSGGGGGGADSTGAGPYVIGGNGGGGEYAEGIFSAAQIGSSQTITIGTVGAAGSGTNGTDGTVGGTTSLGSLMTAIGGGPGIGTTAASSETFGAQGAGGTGGTGGNFRVAGQSGRLPVVGSTASPIDVQSGGGGNSLLGFGAAPRGTTDLAGNAGQIYGGGGGGGVDNDTSGSAGGAGALGVAIIEEFVLT